jgi:CHAT domain-containing protein/Tfp pilus assembly protein PilF
LQRSLQINEAKFGKDHPQVALSLNNLAALYWEQGRYGQAEPLFLRSLKIKEDRLGKDDTDVALSLSNLALLYKEQGLHTQAEPLLQRSLQIREAKFGKDHLLVAASLHNLAALWVAQGRYGKAEPLYQRSLQIYQDQLGKDHPEVALSLNNLAGLYQEQGHHSKAEPLFLRSLEIFEARLGKDHPQVATVLNNLAFLFCEREQYDRAEILWRHSLRIWENALGKNHPHAATVLSNLAVLHLKKGQYDRAEPLLQRSLQIRKDQLGKGHPLVAQSLHNLAGLYKDQGQYDQAEPLYQQSLRIYEERLGKDHPDVATSLHNLALLEAARQHWQKAAAHWDRARRLLRRHVGRALTALPPHDQLAFLRRRVDYPLSSACSLALARRQDEALVEAAAGWLLNGKTLTQQALAEQALLARDSANPKLRPLARNLLDVRCRLAALTWLSPKKDGEPEHRQRLEELVQREQELVRQLVQQSGRAEAAWPWVEVDAVRQALPHDSVLIAFARFPVLHFQAKGQERRWQEPRYAAWVIPAAGQGTVQLFDLGEAAPIDTAIGQLRQVLQKAPIALRQLGEVEAERELRQPLQTVGQLVLQPLLPHIGLRKRWLLSPDAALWLVPWASLPLSKGVSAVEKHTISYAVSGRELILSPPSGRTTAPALFADPDFDLLPNASGSERRSTDEEFAFVLRSAALEGLLPRFGRLPGTAAEAAVAPKLKMYTGVEPILFTGPQAREETFKGLRRPRVVVLSTHGFFLPDRDDVPEKEDDWLGAGGPRHKATAKDNPLLRCGLILAGANQREKAIPLGAEDGILTGLEIVGTDLRGCELVVLSACEKGLGQVRQGEGVAGLRQAFQLAGAQSVVATLWQIPDRETAKLMSAFFDHLAKGEAKADALRAAQLEILQARRKRDGAAHPLFWAAFTLTGQWQ